MFIKELEISGFKSFGDKTRISLNSPLSGIVGPNGCGKSNILDALKWVLGEKSVKTMRGDKMEDVIFSGTEFKKPSGYAQVDLLLDNSAKILPLEFQEVKITRKLFRDGQSQFYLNDNRVSRKEVEAILMDTGLGKASYSFMQQGQMDMILSSKPEDRRIIFEEAAGISRFKSQQEESEKKLEQTEFNITRLRDIISELDRELKIKKSQSDKTRIFQDIDEKRQICDQKILLTTIGEMNDNMSKLQDKLKKIIGEREKSRQKILQIEEQIISLDAEKQKVINEMHQKDIVHQINSEKITNLESSIEINQKKRLQAGNDLHVIKQHMENINTRVAALKSQLGSQKQLFLELNHQSGDAEKTIKDINDNIKKSHTRIDEIQNTQKKMLHDVETKRENLKKLRVNREVIIQNLLEFLKKEKDQWQKTLGDIESQKNDFKNKLALFFSSIDNALDKISGNPETSRGILLELSRDIKSSEWISTVEKLSDLEKKFWNLLFEKGGIHSQKEEFDEKIIASEKVIENIETEILNLTHELNSKKDEISLLSSRRDAMIGDLKTFEVQKTNVNEKEKNLSQQIQNEDANLVYFSERHSLIESQLLEINQQDKAMLKEIHGLRNTLTTEQNKLENYKGSILKLDEKKSKLLEQVKKESQTDREDFESVSEIEVKIGTIIGSKEALLQEMYNNYNLTFEELKEKFARKKIDIKTEKDKMLEYQKEIKNLGIINPLAIEEMNTIQSLYDHNVEQINDINKARKDILSVIEEIQSKSEKIFMESFRQIGENFRVTFQKLFKGGDVSLKLTEETNPLNSGIEIQVQPPGKRARSLRLLSGGEKALTAIALMFAVYMVKSSPFCVLDEIDAPLDDQNVGRFLTLLDDFKNNTQFLLITHNKKTMGKCDTLFGVTMDEPGISKLLSVEIKAS